MYVIAEYLVSLVVVAAIAVILFGASVLALIVRSAGRWLTEKSRTGVRAVNNASVARSAAFRLFHGHPQARN